MSIKASYIHADITYKKNLILNIDTQLTNLRRKKRKYLKEIKELEKELKSLGGNGNEMPYT